MAGLSSSTVRLHKLWGSGALRTHALFRTARGRAFSTLISGAFAQFGHGTVIEPPVRIKGAARISLGSNVFVGSGSWLQVLDGAAEADAPAVVIGDGAFLAGSCVLSAVASIHVGSHASLARNVYIADHMHEFSKAGTPVLDQGITRILPVHIGVNARLGENVVVGPGVSIGDDAVIGANSVVLDDVPAGSVVIGAPAQIVTGTASAPGHEDGSG